MEDKLNKIKEAIEKELIKIDIEVSDISYKKDGKYNFLTIELDKVNGIDLDTIVKATDIINPIIDRLDLIDDTYIMDVVSKERGN